MNTINIQSKKLTSSEIEKFKDFQRLKEKYNRLPKKNPFRNGLNIAGITIIISIIFITTRYFIHGNSTIILENTNANTPFVTPPLPQCDIPYNNVEYNNSNDTTILFSSGTTISILKNSIIDSSGSIVNGSIEIRYREFMNPAEIFLAGISMEYDSCGIKYTFESAGMIEIAAFCNNKPLFIKPNKPILISFLSDKSTNDYNLYFLDTIQRNWIFKGKDKVVVNNNRKLNTIGEFDQTILPDTSITNSKTSSEPEIQKPLPPILANPKKWHFTVDIIESEFPELNEYKKTVFEIDETYKPLDPLHPKITWDEVNIEKTSEPLHYYVTFKIDNKESRYLVCPVLTGEGYNIALKNYENKYLNYQRLLAERKKKEELQLKLIAEIKESNKRDSIYFDNLSALQRTKDKVIRSFEIMNFGIWNCDKVIKLNLMEIEPTFKINDTICYTNFYLADNSRNALFSVSQVGKLRFDRSSKNLIWTIMDKNHAAVFTEKDFAKIPKSSKKYIFHLRKIERTIESSKDFLELYHSGFQNR